MAWCHVSTFAFVRVLDTYLRGCSYEDIEKGGGHEMLNWMAVMGAMGGKPADIIAYEAVMEWICGLGLVKEPLPMDVHKIAAL